MGLTLLDGAKPFKSYIYANLASWEAGPSGCTIYVGAEKKRVEFLTPDGDEITGLIAVHAQEIADKYMADRRRQSQHREQQEQRASARRSRGEAEAAEGERPARRAEAPQSKQELRRQQLGTPPPSSAQPAAASADAQRERAFSQGVSLFAEEEEAAGSPPQATNASIMSFSSSKFSARSFWFSITLRNSAKSIDPDMFSSTSEIIWNSSSSVGFCPIASNTCRSSHTSIVPLRSVSKAKNASRQPSISSWLSTMG